jgi:hypothetical protein
MCRLLGLGVTTGLVTIAFLAAIELIPPASQDPARHR